MRTLAAKGHKHSQYYIGVSMFKEANGSAKTQKEAVEWIRKAADAGLRDAAAQLGS